MSGLVKGANAALRTASGLPCGTILVGVTWRNNAADVDACAFLCDAQGAVLSDEHFLYWNAPMSPTNDAALRSAPVGGPSGVVDRAQLVMDLTRLDARVERVVLSLSTLAPGQSLAVAGPTELRLIDLETEGAGELYTYVNSAGYVAEQCVVIAEIYRRAGEWKVRVVDQGYAEGLAALARQHAVNVE